ncbi:MAG: undecaprenyl-diphosphate phosphatase [Gammaproteobacteria bacterium HGW-Gammaproteobacteria-7]|nr:MAG: undecaprenyl-diphosphate phosphatase [Gammaproteobacteria bacterium HGW-Gammaproteobacteria-7]
MNETLSAILLGLIEGLTEFLPISSTGHLLIAQHWLGARSDLFNIVIQAGAILAIVLVYRQRLQTLALGMGVAANRAYLAKIAVAFAVTAVIGIPVRLSGWELPETVAPVAWALVLGGLWMLIAERLAERRPSRAEITWAVAVLVGVAQVVAGVFPGTSRSAAAIFIALLAGTNNRPAATEFVFLVGIPTMFAASAYAVLEHLLNQGSSGEPWGQLVLAFAAASATGFIAVRWLLGYIKQHRYTPFAIYRIALGIALLLWLPSGE